VEVRVLPRDWPATEFDLVVLSELAYYFDPDAKSPNRHCQRI
jgi:hypothetical protein